MKSSEQQRVIKDRIIVPQEVSTLVGYNHEGILIAGAKVKGDFNCSHTKISSLRGSPAYVGGNFICHNTRVSSFEGAPTDIRGSFDCYKTNIHSLHNIHKHIKHLGGHFYLPATVVESVMGVMLIKGVKKIMFFLGTERQQRVEHIITKHLYGDRDPHSCQEELIEAGFGEYAKI